MAVAPLIALLTDFGTRDWYVASIKAVILSRAPAARLVDITHDVPSFNITAGAFTLAAVANGETNFVSGGNSDTLKKLMLAFKNADVVWPNTDFF